MNFQNSESAGQSSKKNWKFLLYEVFIAVSLSVTFFFLVRNYFDDGNPMNSNVFMAGSEKLYRLNAPIIGAHWNERLSGLLLTGALMDYSLSEKGADAAQAARLRDAFGAYHACWLLLLFVCIIFALRHSLFINFGIFAGLMYDFTPTSGPYFFPWDIPAMFFFTLAALFFARRHIWLMLVAIFAGAFFNESILACAPFVLFTHWKPARRILAFIGVITAYLLAKEFLLSPLQIHAPMLSARDLLTLHGTFSPVKITDTLLGNLRVLFSPTLNSVVFANAGTLVAVLALCWQKRLLPYMVVILAFLAALFLIAYAPGISEVRDFMPVLPLCIILLSERWPASAERASIVEPSPSPVFSLSTQDTFSLLLPLTVTIVAISTVIAAFQYNIIYEDLQPGNLAQSQLGKYIHQGGSPVSLEALSQWFQNGYTDAELKLAVISQQDHRDVEAIEEYQHVLDLDTNSFYALNNLATLLATDSDPHLRDGNRAVHLAEQACQLTQYHEAALIYTLAAAYAEAGRYNDAVTAADKARMAALAQGQTDIAKANEPLVELYKSGHAFHQQAEPAP